jgi:hypothetical protein
LVGDADDQTRTGGARAGLAALGGSAVVIANSVVNPVAGVPNRNVDSYDPQQDVIVSVEDTPVSEASSLYTLDGEVESAGKHALESTADLVGAVVADSKSRDGTLDDIESASDLESEYSDLSDPQDNQGLGLYDVELSVESAPERNESLSDLGLAEADPSVAIDEAATKELAELDNALNDIANSELADFEAPAEAADLETGDMFADISDSAEVSDLGGDTGYDGAFGGDAGVGDAGSGQF